MKQYKVLRPMINAPVGTILKENHARSLENSDSDWIVGYDFIDKAIAQKFIEPYTPEPKHWRAEMYEKLWYVCYDAGVKTERDEHSVCDDAMYELGNYFKSKQTAELVAKAQKLFFEYLHTTPGTPQQNIKNEFEKAHAEARKAVLEDDSNE